MEQEPHNFLPRSSDVWSIKPSSLKGSLNIPSSKSHSIRALLFALLSKGTSEITHLLDSPDVEAMLLMAQHLGARMQRTPHKLLMEGVDGKIQGAEDVIQAGNSGLVLRFATALGALSSSPLVVTGDYSIRHRRPLYPLLSALNQLGAEALSTRGDHSAPVIVRGPLTRGVAHLEGSDSQPVSALLVAASYGPLEVELHVSTPGELPWIDLTCSWLERLHIPYKRSSDYTHYILPGAAHTQSFNYAVPGDFSSAAFPLVAALITDSELTLNNLDMNDVQGDKNIVPLLEKMGANITLDASTKRLKVQRGGQLRGEVIDINSMIDALPILAVLGCFASGKTELRHASIARHKESDRLTAITRQLRKMGAHIEEFPEGLCIYPSLLQGATLEGEEDHRIAMALTVAALGAKGSTLLRGVKCIHKSYPHFQRDFQALGAVINTVGEGI